jgi:hypothetical protein
MYKKLCPSYYRQSIYRVKFTKFKNISQAQIDIKKPRNLKLKKRGQYRLVFFEPCRTKRH